MTNWCDNTMIIRGKEKEVKKLLDMIRGDEEYIDFEKIIPIPPEITKDATEIDFKSWCMENWEATGNATNSSLVVKHTRPFEEAEILFDTPIGCPMPILKKISQMFPEMYIRIITTEPNMGWGVVLEYKYGKLQTTLYGNYDPFEGEKEDQEEND